MKSRLYRVFIEDSDFIPVNVLSKSPGCGPGKHESY